MRNSEEKSVVSVSWYLLIRVIIQEAQLKQFMLQTYMKDLGLKEKYEYLRFSYCYAINYDFESAILTHICMFFPHL